MKRGILILIALVFMLVLQNCFIARAAFGVSPAFYQVNFQPHLKQDFYFGFIFDSETQADIYAEGDLAKYVTLNKKSIKGSEGVTATLELPGEITVPGKHDLFIGARQKAQEGEGMGIIGNVKGLIRVHVPYPGKYVEANFDVNNANAGDIVEFQVNLKNLGNEEAYFYGTIEIKGSNGNIETINIDSRQLKSSEEYKFLKILDTTDYKPGDYNVTLMLDYGGKDKISISKILRLGQLYVGIADYTRVLEADKINPFEITGESFWNNPVENIYANVSIENSDLNFVTPSISIGPWQKVNLTGFLDTKQINNTKFNANITLYYNGKSTSKIVSLMIKREINYTLYLIIGGVVLIVGALIILIVIMYLKLKQNKPHGKKK